MDSEYLNRVVKRLNDMWNHGNASAYNVPKDASYGVAMANIFGYLQAIKDFEKILQSELNPPAAEPVVEPPKAADE